MTATPAETYRWTRTLFDNLLDAMTDGDLEEVLQSCTDQLERCGSLDLPEIEATVREDLRRIVFGAARALKISPTVNKKRVLGPIVQAIDEDRLFEHFHAMIGIDEERYDASTRFGLIRAEIFNSLAEGASSLGLLPRGYHVGSWHWRNTTGDAS